MRFTFVSDSHSLHNRMKYKINSFIDPFQTNILIHAGDVTNVGKEHEVEDFVNWFTGIKRFDKKIFIAGNHDMSFESKPPWLSHYIDPKKLLASDTYYL